MLKCYVSDYQESGAYEMSDEQLTKWALGQVLHAMGLFLQREAQRNEIDMPTSIRVEVIKKGWDIQVRLYPQKERENVVP